MYQFKPGPLSREASAALNDLLRRAHRPIRGAAPVLVNEDSNAVTIRMGSLSSDGTLVKPILARITLRAGSNPYLYNWEELTQDSAGVVSTLANGRTGTHATETHALELTNSEVDEDTYVLIRQHANGIRWFDKDELIDEVIEPTYDHAPVRAATTANITLSGAQTIDGVSIIAGDYVLVKNQSAPAQNGVYTAATGTWSRRADVDTWDELVGALIVVCVGTLNADSIWLCTSDAGGTLDTTAVTWVKVYPTTSTGTHSPVRVATTANVALSTALENGDTLDGVTLATGDRVLVKDQSAPAENGIYVVAAAGTPSRATDADEWDELSGVLVVVREGTLNADSIWLCTSNQGGTLNTTAVTWTRVHPTTPVNNRRHVRVATTATLSLSTDLENGDTVDGVTLATGDRVLVKDQSSAATNGIYVVAASGTAARATDADEWDELVSSIIAVSEGTSNADSIWLCTSNNGGTLETTAVNWTKVFPLTPTSSRRYVRVATTANISLSTALENGDTLDGETLATGDRVLVKDQSAPAENGIYVVAASGTAARAEDADTWEELVASLIVVSEGTANADTIWLCTSDAGGTLETTAVDWVKVYPDYRTRAPVRVATTANISLSTGLENGDSIDSVAIATGDRVLVKNQTAPAENGIYIVSSSGTAARAADANVWEELVGYFVAVREGTINANSVWTCTVNTGGTLETTAVTWIKVALTVAESDGSPSYTGISSLRFDSTATTGSFVVSQPAEGIALVTAQSASATQYGVVTTTTQEFAGLKKFTTGIWSESINFNSSTGTYGGVTGVDSTSISLGTSVGLFGSPGSGQSFTAATSSNTAIFFLRSAGSGVAEPAFAVYENAGPALRTGQWGTLVDGSVVSGGIITTIGSGDGGYTPGGTDVPVSDGGTGASSFTAYAVICGGTTSTGALQSVASVGTAGQVLTSNGAGALPTFENATGVSDGDKGDVVVSSSGTVWTVDAGVITFAKMQAVSANILLGNDASGTTVEEIACTAFGRSLIDDADAAAGRATLGGTTVGQAYFTLTNPSAITFPRMNADNTVTALSASDFRTAIGAGTSSTTYTDEEARDAIGTALTAGTGIGITVNDGADTITVALSFLGLQALTDPGADRIAFWDDSAGAFAWLTVGTGLSITDTTIACTITQYTDEMARDALGTALTDSTEIDFAVDDGADTITATLKTTTVTPGSYTNADITVDSKGRITAASNGSSGSSYTDEQAQDAVGGILTDTDTIDQTYNDGSNTISASVKTQMSITSDSSGIKLSGDSGSPGNSKLYGTNGSGTKGWYDQPTAPVEATQAEMEAGSSTTVFVSPAKQKLHPSSPKAWVCFQGVGTVVIYSSFGVSSITDNGTGNYSVNWSTNFSATTYCPVVSVSHATTVDMLGEYDSATIAVGSVKVFTLAYQTGALTDANLVSVMAFGDQ